MAADIDQRLDRGQGSKDLPMTSSSSLSFVDGFARRHIGSSDAEIALIAQQSDVPERRVRARLEKQGQMDALRNQIIERKVIEMIVEAAKVTEETVSNAAADEDGEFAVDHSVLAAKDDDAIPQAKYEDNTPAGAEKEKEKD